MQGYYLQWMHLIKAWYNIFFLLWYIFHFHVMEFRAAISLWHLSTSTQYYTSTYTWTISSIKISINYSVFIAIILYFNKLHIYTKTGIHSWSINKITWLTVMQGGPWSFWWEGSQVFTIISSIFLFARKIRHSFLFIMMVLNKKTFGRIGSISLFTTRQILLFFAL